MEKNKKRIFIGLGIVQLFVAINAIPAGIMLVLDPGGGMMKWTVDVLKNAPFPNFLIPGLVLLLLHGFGSLTGGILSFRRHRYCGLFAMVLGLGLFIWIVAQVWWMGLTVFLQPLIFVVSIIEMILGYMAHKKLIDEYGRINA